MNMGICRTKLTVVYLYIRKDSDIFQTDFPEVNFEISRVHIVECVAGHVATFPQAYYDPLFPTSSAAFSTS